MARVKLRNEPVNFNVAIPPILKELSLHVFIG